MLTVRFEMSIYYYYYNRPCTHGVFVVAINRQVGQGEITVLQDESMDPLVLGAFFMHPDQGLSIAKEWVQVGDQPIGTDVLSINAAIFLQDFNAFENLQQSCWLRLAKVASAD